MQLDYSHSYLGHYRGIVVDSKDPLEKGRVRMMVPQVFGEEITDWAWPVGGALHQTGFPYGTFITTAGQTVTAANTATVVTGWSIADSNKTRVNGTKIYVEETGDYFLQFSAVLTKSSASTHDAGVWVRKNGADVPDSTTSVTLSGSSSETVVTVGLILDLQANDYIEIVFYGVESSTALIYHAAGTSPTRPATPGVIAAITLVGKYVPRVGQAVWAAFEGGDPNFPLWLGTF